MPLPLDTMTVQTREQAKLLLDDTYTRVLECAMQTQVSASEIAQKITMPLQQVHHRLTKLMQAGLVKVVDEKQRHGRPIKLYAAVAPAYRIPVQLTEAADLEEVMWRTTTSHWEAVCRASAQLFEDDQSMEFLFIVDSTGHLRQNLNPARILQESIKPSYGTLCSLTTLSLTPETMTEAEMRLRDFMKWLGERMKEEQHDPRARPALVTIGIVPAGEDA